MAVAQLFNTTLFHRVEVNNGTYSNEPEESGQGPVVQNLVSTNPWLNF